ncbi:MAG: hypothetical protein EBE86_000160 [Hormoscilla sp. GUM202]|nr:hypothetical protein [Hormoscilla sp. GUM202]
MRIGIVATIIPKMCNALLTACYLRSGNIRCQSKAIGAIAFDLPTAEYEMLRSS